MKRTLAATVAAALLAGCTTTIVDPEVGDQTKLDENYVVCAKVAQDVAAPNATPPAAYKGLTVFQVFKKCLETKGYRILP